MWAERRSPSAPAWLLILAVHAGVLVVLNAQQRAPVGAPRDWSELRILPFSHAPVPKPPAPAQTPAPRPPVLGAPPGPEPAPAAPVDTTEPAPVDTTPAPQPPPLQLSLPAQLSHQPALDDPRSNTPIGRFGQHITNDLGGDGRWQEERMDADTVRLRRGNSCINLHRNRTAGRQPFDEASAPTPWGATPAYRCERR